jgi:ketosteroid isomerase-like protein
MTLQNRRALTTPALTALALGLCAMSAQAKETAQQVAARRAIAAQYARADRAVLKKDLTTIMAMCAPDFTAYSSSTGQMNRAQYEAMQKATLGMPNSRFTLSTTKIRKIEWRGVDAIVWNSSVLVGTLQGVPIRITGEARDYWRPTKAGWQVSQSVILNMKTMANGKVVTQQ